MTERDSIPYPPRGLCREEAARFVGVGSTTFDRMVDEGKMPKPLRYGKRAIWDRIKLDAAFADLDSDNRENYFDGGLKVVNNQR